MKRILFILLIFYQDLLHAQINWGPSITVIDAEAHLLIPEYYNIGPADVSPSIVIKGGLLNIRISGVMDRFASTQIAISMVAEDIYKDKTIFFVSKDSQFIQYKMDGIAIGSYAGIYKDGYFRIFLRFKIIAENHPSYLLDIPVNIYISPLGIIHNDKLFIDGVGYVYDSNKMKKKKIISPRPSFNKHSAISNCPRFPVNSLPIPAIF